MEAVKEDAYWLQFASMELRNNFDIVMAAVKAWGGAVRLASQRLKTHYEIAMAAVRKEAIAFQYVSDDLQNNFQLAMVAVKQCGWLLIDVSDELKNNYQVVKAAVEQDGRACRYASDEMRADLSILAAAIMDFSRYYSDYFDDFTIPESLAARMEAAVAFLQNNETYQHLVRVRAKESAFRNYAEETWKPLTRAKIVALVQTLLVHNIDSKVGKVVLGFLDVPEEFRMANELIRLSPIFGALSERRLSPIFGALSERRLTWEDVKEDDEED